jgi:hypothetical protein
MRLYSGERSLAHKEELPDGGPLLIPVLIIPFGIYAL